MVRSFPSFPAWVLKTGCFKVCLLWQTRELRQMTHWTISGFLEDTLLNCSAFCSEKKNRQKLLEKLDLAPNRRKCLDGGEHSLFWL